MLNRVKIILELLDQGLLSVNSATLNVVELLDENNYQEVLEDLPVKIKLKLKSVFNKPDYLSKLGVSKEIADLCKTKLNL